ncbi:MAG TPA: preprotein translocase subunit SecE [Candidatus Methylomirabilis sp.]|nr:preprotein translocase subunit SecE [Candidatus Methylomirabilis sp.]
MTPITTVRDYLKSSVAELRKVTWPSRDMTIRYAALVIVASVALAMFFAALDFGLSRAVTFALERKPAVEAPQPTVPELTPDAAPAAAPNTTVETQPAAPADGGLQLPPLETPKP